MPTIIVCMIGAIILAGIITYGRRKRTTSTFIVPFLLWASFSAVVYLTRHHIGITALFFVFWLWISLSADAEEMDNTVVPERESGVKPIAVFFITVMLAISLYWTASASIKDVFFTYSPGREEAAFITEHELDQHTVLVYWDVYKDEEGNILSMDINHHNCADNVSPYLDSNIFFNFNNGDDQVCYSTHKSASEQETVEALSDWAQITPDVLFMSPPLEVIYGDELSVEDDYTLVYSRVWSMPWKGWSTKGRANIHVRNSLAEELGLPEIEEDQTFVKDLLDALSVSLS